MATIYVHASVLGASDAAERLAHLSEAGHRLIVVAGASRPGMVEPAELTRLDTLPAEPEQGSWFVTADPATCGDRRAGFRTLLVGPRLDERRPTRCDSTARDLREAVLDILAADAMD
jgi:hypothetical protein